ncbi:hypothetical protein [Chryseobacterium sp. Leaf201]|uniref:hypothetical protein n=1 Tax=Chryseobacterium sp. Leaf201 TaxID=1735672 RepID=UPI000FF88CA2|nr:hypothetical protein [Chryseobacterium sp. Leaf201]
MKTSKSLRRAVAPVFLGSLLSAQVGINTDLPTKTLDVNPYSARKGYDVGNHWCQPASWCHRNGEC